jgi:hypothetical protein
VGDGAAGYNGDGELNTSAELNGPTGLDMDAANFIYVADTNNHIIRKTLLTGTTPNPIATVAGTPGSAGYFGDGGSAISAQLNSPQGVRVDAAGDIYIADFKNQAIRKVNAANGVISTVAGSGTAGYTGDGGAASKAQLNAPATVQVDENANLYIADSQNSVIRKINVSDAPSIAFASTPMGSASAPQDVTVMNLGNAPLNISQITTAANYSLGGSDTSCNSTGAETLDAATSCILGIEFTPKTTGNITGSIILADNGTPSSQTIALNGTTNAQAASYTLTAKTPTVSLTAGGNGTATLTLTSSNFAGTISFVTSVSSTDGTVANLTATATPVTLTPGSTGTSTLMVSANTHAANRLPSVPGEISATAVFCALLLCLPLTLQRRRTVALILFALAIPLAGSLIACGGATKNASTSSARTYIVTATPAASPAGLATNPAAVTITVTVQ